MKPKLLIVDDDVEILTQMKWALTDSYEIKALSDPETAISCFGTEKPDMVMLDLGLPPNPNDTTMGFSVLEKLLNIEPSTKVVVITGQGERENALKAIGIGAYDFMSKPVEIDSLKIILKRGCYVARLEKEHRELQSSAPDTSFENMVGNSGPMRKVFETIRKVSLSEVPVLILGESGTGKEMAAQAIHRRSSRKDGPFVAINCGAIPENLLESELFGHEKGAFTGAHVQREGRIENANGGTLFLDEIGEMPLSLQVKLLRFLQEQKIVRVGGREEIGINTRVIAATNINVKQSMADGRLREDLYYRLAVVQLELPPLRDREQDIMLLAQAFLLKFSSESNKTGLTFSPEAVQAILKFRWPGNVRELENRIRRAVIMTESSKITLENLDLPEQGTNSTSTLKEARMVLEKEMIQKALKKHSGKITTAAEELGISRPTFYELMDKLGIQPV